LILEGLRHEAALFLVLDRVSHRDLGRIVDAQLFQGLLQVLLGLVRFGVLGVELQGEFIAVLSVQPRHDGQHVTGVGEVEPLCGDLEVLLPVDGKGQGLAEVLVGEPGFFRIGVHVDLDPVVGPRHVDQGPPFLLVLGVEV